MSIPIIEEELIELFLLCRGDYSTLTFQRVFFWRSDHGREKLFGQDRKKEREEKKLDGDSRDGPWCRTAVSSNQLAGESPN